MTRYFDGHKIPFAVDADGMPRSVEQVIRGLACNCICPQCKMPLVANQGERRLKIWHFSHKANTQCAGALESSLHLAVKSLIEEHKQLLIPPCIVYLFHPEYAYPVRQGLGIGEFAHDLYKYTYDASGHDNWREKGAGKGMHPTKPQLIKFDSVNLEQTEGNIRPDIVGIARGRKLYIEVAVTHFIDDEKLRRLRARGTPTIELVVPFEENYEFNWEKLKNWLFNEIEGKYWALNRKVESLADTDSIKQREDFAKREVAARRQAKERARKTKLREERIQIWKEQKRTQELARAKAEADAKIARAEAEEIAVREREKEWKEKREEGKLQRLGLLMIEAYEDDKNWEIVHAAEKAHRARINSAYERLAGKPSSTIDPNRFPVLFLDYDTAIQPGSTQEQARLQILSNALKGKLCSVVITSRIRQGLNPDELSRRMGSLGGRHIGATPIIDPDDSYGTRNEEIREWLKQHSVTSICIIDGSKTGLPVKPVWVSTRYGLTQNDANQLNFIVLR